MQKKIYYIINLLFLTIAVFSINYIGIFYMNFSLKQLIILLTLFLLIHLFKFIRISFILLEEMIPIKQMIKIYIKSTFVNITLPYKIGEIFRIYLYGNVIKNYPKGLFAVVVEKFYDSILICLCLIPYSIINKNGFSNLALILSIFIIAILTFYIAFYGTYLYLNRFFITKVNNNYSLYILRLLEKFKNIYQIGCEMLRGRQVIILLLTLCSWICEGIFVYIMANFMNLKANFNIIVDYLSDSFFGIHNLIFNNSVYLCLFIFCIMIIIIYVKKIIKLIIEKRRCVDL